MMGDDITGVWDSALVGVACCVVILTEQADIPALVGTVAYSVAVIFAIRDVVVDDP